MEISLGESVLQTAWRIVKTVFGDEFSKQAIIIKNRCNENQSWYCGLFGGVINGCWSAEEVADIMAVYWNLAKNKQILEYHLGPIPYSQELERISDGCGQNTIKVKTVLHELYWAYKEGYINSRYLYPINYLGHANERVGDNEDNILSDLIKSGKILLYAGAIVGGAYAVNLFKKS